MLMMFWRRLRKYRIIFFIILLSAMEFAHALETDQFMVWDKTLADSTSVINSYINKKIARALVTINRKKLQTRKKYSCEGVHKYIAKKIVGRISKGLGTSELEKKLAKGKIKADTYPAQGLSSTQAIKSSVYARSLLFRLKIFGFTININGVYLGTDKLDHIFSTGHAYYKNYQKCIKKGCSHNQALQRAITAGIRQERTYYGSFVSGVFSYADLEANYQGLKFHLNFCHGRKPYLTRDKQHKWKLARLVNIRDYVTPYFDESWNNNAYTKGRFRDIIPFLKGYCNKRRLSAKRFAGYERRKQKNEFIIKLDKLKKLGKVPTNYTQTLDAICKP